MVNHTTFRSIITKTLPIHTHMWATSPPTPQQNTAIFTHLQISPINTLLQISAITTQQHNTATITPPQRSAITPLTAIANIPPKKAHTDQAVTHTMPSLTTILTTTVELNPTILLHTRAKKVLNLTHIAQLALIIMTLCSQLLCLKDTSRALFS